MGGKLSSNTAHLSSRSPRSHGAPSAACAPQLPSTLECRCARLAQAHDERRLSVASSIASLDFNPLFMLSDELLLHVVSFLDVHSIAAVSQVSAARSVSLAP